MRLPRLAIDNAPFTIVVLVMLALMGLVSFFTMPRSEDPQFDIPTVSVIAVMPGASPEDVERLVVDPIEDEVSTLDDIDQIETSIRDGLARVVVKFLQTADPDEAEEEVTRSVNNVRNVLPDAVRTVNIVKRSPTDVNILQLALVSDTASYRTLERVADDLEQALERVAGVQEVDTWAIPEVEVQVDLDLERLRATGLQFGQVVAALQDAAPSIPGGAVAMGTRRFTVQTTGAYASLDEIRETVVHGTPDGLVRLQDVADVRMGTDDISHRGRFNGQRAVFVTAQQREGANIFDVMEGIQAEQEAFMAAVPDGVTVKTMFDQSESVSERIGGFFGSLRQGIALVGVVIVLALGFRASVVVMLSIPLSILLAIGAVDATGYGLQQISIVGLVIALGLLVDDAIVITENVARFRRQGLSRREAALRGTQEVGWAVISTSVTSILAFVPIVLVQSGSGAFIRSMPVTVIYALLASLLVTLTLIPLLASRFLDGTPADTSEASDASTKASALAGGWLQPLLRRLTVGPYRRTLRAALAHPWVVLGLAAGTFVGSVALFPLIGVSFFPEAEKPQFLVSVTTPEGTSFEATDAAVQRVEDWLDGRSEVRRYAANVGRDNPVVYYNEIPRNERSTHGQVFVEATSADAVKSLADALRADLDRQPDMDIDISIFTNGPPVEAPIALKIIGPDLETLEALAAETAARIRQAPGTMNVDNPLEEPKTDLLIQVDRDKAGLLGVRLLDVDQTVRAAMAGLPVASFQDADGEDRAIVLRLPRTTERARMSDFERITVPSRRTGAQIPLLQVASLDLKPVPARIDHFNTERAVTLTADVDTDAGHTVVDVTQDVVAGLNTDDWPPGYRTFVGGELEAQEDSFASLYVALIGAILGILAILVLQFSSLRQPFIIFTAIPLSVIGAFPALLLVGYTFSFTAFIGFTSLVGIVVNTSTILVDYANQLRDAGHSLHEAVRIASETRFAPILLTTLTTIGGVLPLTLTGSSLWSPLGTVIIGGLLVSTLLTLLVVPVLYERLTPATPAG